MKKLRVCIYLPMALILLQAGCGGSSSPQSVTLPEPLSPPVIAPVPEMVSAASRWVIMPANRDADLDIDGVALLANQAIYAGFIYGDNKLLSGDSGSLPVPNDTRYMLLGRWNRDGLASWKRIYGTSSSRVNAYDVTAQPNGDQFVSGSFSGYAPDLNLDNRNGCQHRSQPVTRDGQYGQSFLGRFNADGDLLWSTQTASGYYVSGGNEVELGPLDSVVQVHTAGRLGDLADTCQPLVVNSQLLFGSQGIVLDTSDDLQSPATDTLISVHSRNTGELIMAPMHVGGSGKQNGKALTTTLVPDPRIIVGVDISGPTTLYTAEGGNELITGKIKRDDQDGLIVVYDYQGKPIWHRVFGTEKSLDLSQYGLSQDEEIKGVVTDDEGHVYVAGTLVGELSTNGYLYQPSDLGVHAKSMGFLAKLDRDTGETIWLATFGGDTLTLRCCELSIDNGVIYATPTIVGDVLRYKTRDRVTTQALLKVDGQTRRGFVMAVDRDGQWLSYAYPHTKGNSSASEIDARDGNILVTGIVSGDWMSDDQTLTVPSSRAEYLWYLSSASMIVVPSP